MTSAVGLAGAGWRSTSRFLKGGEDSDRRSKSEMFGVSWSDTHLDNFGKLWKQGRQVCDLFLSPGAIGAAATFNLMPRSDARGQSSALRGRRSHEASKSG